MLSFSQSTGIMSLNGQPIAQGWAGNDSRPGVNPDHIHGFNNPDAQSIHCIGPLPQGTYTIGVWGDHPVVGANSAPLTQVEGETFGRNGFFIHGPGADPANSSEGCIVIPHDQRLVVQATAETQLQVTA